MTLVNLLKDRTLILGSKSARRQELLAALDIDFSIDCKFNCEEDYPEDLEKSQIPAYLAKKKSLAFYRDLKDNEILLTADTLVLCEDKVLGKPKNEEEAVEMLKFLSAKKHRVISAFTLRSNKKIQQYTQETSVFFKALTEDEIHYYIDSYKPLDKAGAYGIQEWIGYIGIEKIEGSYYNVMGLDLAQLYQALKEFLKDA